MIQSVIPSATATVVTGRMASRWRTLFVGLAWRSSAAIALEIIGERGAERASGAIDRTLELRLARRFDITGARVVA